MKLRGFDGLVGCARRGGLLGLALLLAAFGVLAAETLRLCPACGREAAGAVCAGCGGAVPAVPTAPVVPLPEAVVAPDPAAALADQVWPAVQADVQAARACEAERPAVSLFYYRNASALLRLMPVSSVSAGVPEILERGVGAAKNAMRRGRVVCPDCSGNGEYAMQAQALKGSTSTLGKIKSGGMRCPTCRGTGQIDGLRSFEATQVLLAQARQAYEQQQRLSGRVACGLSWVPATWPDLLTIRQQALLRTGVPVPCEACQGTGRQTCTTCRGAGDVKCTATGCKDGVIEVRGSSLSGSASRRAESAPKRCAVCNGLGRVRCTGCQGEGAVGCRKCSGSGTSARCTKCVGEGIQPCARCQGSGKIKDQPCAACQGGGEILCPTCRGGGYLPK